MSYPTIRVSGSPEQRGQQYGRLAEERIRRSIALYAEVLAKRVDWSWADATKHARVYRDEIEQTTDLLPELAGIASGAGVDLLDIVALNARTELIALAGSGERSGARKADGCTAFSATTVDAAGRRSLTVGQNWDWLTPTTGTVVVLEVSRDDAPNYVTVVEAGLLAKAGLNSAGLAVCTNYLVTESDGTSSGLPYHVVLRSLFDQETLPEALGFILRHRRSSSANYLLGHADGSAVDIEVTPGGAESVHVHTPVNGVVTHANHFRADVAEDISVFVTPDSPFRQATIDDAIAARGDQLTQQHLRDILADHTNFPRSICAHSDLRVAEHERETTSYGLIMEVADRRMFITDGNPCTSPWRELEVSALLADRRPAPQDIAPAVTA